MPTETLAITWETMANWEAAGVRFYRGGSGQLLYSLNATFVESQVKLNDFFMSSQREIAAILDLREDKRTFQHYESVRYAVENNLMTEGQEWESERVARLRRELATAEEVRDSHKTDWDEACKRVDTLKTRISEEKART